MTLTHETAKALLPKINSLLGKQGGCSIWLGPKYDSGGKERRPCVGLGHNFYRVRRVLWTAEHGVAPFGQIYRMTCGTAWCVDPEHTEVCGKRRTKAEQQQRRVELNRLARERAKKRADLRCEDCGRQRTPTSISRCAVCFAKRRSSGTNKAYGVAHLKNVHQAREFRKRLSAGVRV